MVALSEDTAQVCRNAALQRGVYKVTACRPWSYRNPADELYRLVKSKGEDGGGVFSYWKTQGQGNLSRVCFNGRSWGMDVVITTWQNILEN